MCILCTAGRKGRSLSKLLGNSHRLVANSSGSGIAAVENNAATWQSLRVYSAVPQPADTTSTNKIDGYAMHPSTLNPNVLKAQYAVRGELYNKAVELAGQGRDIIYTNGGCCRMDVVDMSSILFASLPFCPSLCVIVDNSPPPRVQLAIPSSWARSL